MPAGLQARRRAAERKNQAFQLYCSGVRLVDIGKQLGISASVASRMVRRAAAEQPAAGMTPQERSGLAMELLMTAHGDVRQELAAARAQGRTDDVRSLLAIQSLSASRCARVLEAQPEVVQQTGPVFNLQAFQQLTGSGGQQQQIEASPVEPIEVRVEAS